MRVGIISMQRIYNYGSFLQAYALKRMMENRGHDVSFADINAKKDYAPAKQGRLQRTLERMKKFDRYIFRRVSDSKKNKQLIGLLKREQSHYLGLNDTHMTEAGCDAVIIGSDEIFNCSSRSLWGINGQRFGNIPGVGTIISYAASCGYTDVSYLASEDRQEVIDGLKKLNYISVRDQNTYNFVKAVSGRTAEINLDPVLIYDFHKEQDQIENVSVPKFPYMVVYAYHNRIESIEEINAIKRYAQSRGLRTIAIGGSLPWCDEFVVLTPFQVLAYFKHASCIVTDTFHGTVFSVKFNKPFAVIVRESNANKLDDLIQRLGVEPHKVSDMQKLDAALDMVDDYESTNAIIATEIEHACAYLTGAGF